jgi:hypothetical protein
LQTKKKPGIKAVEAIPPTNLQPATQVIEAPGTKAGAFYY